MSPPSNPTPESSPKPSFTVEATGADWFNREVYAHDDRLKAYLRGSFPSMRDVDDVVQQSYLQIWRRQMLQPLVSARSFLYSVARNLAIDALRRETKSPVERGPNLAGLEVFDGGLDPAEAACTGEELDLLAEAIASLPTRCREVVLLRRLYGMSPPQIARKLGISEGTVHLQGAKGLRRCEEYLRARGAGFK